MGTTKRIGVPAMLLQGAIVLIACTSSYCYGAIGASFCLFSSMTIWPQVYDPIGNLYLSALIAAIPAVLLLVLIAGFNVRIHVAALVALAACLLIAVGFYRMPAAYAASSTIYGAAYGLFPIGWLVLNIIFIYQLTVQAGLFDVLRRSLARIAPDPRIQVILIAFAFGSFLEGMSGFGAPVAITAAILIQLRFPPLLACGLALVANTAPVAFGRWESRSRRSSRSPIWTSRALRHGRRVAGAVLFLHTLSHRRDDVRLARTGRRVAGALRGRSRLHDSPIFARHLQRAVAGGAAGGSVLHHRAGRPAPFLAAARHLRLQRGGAAVPGAPGCHAGGN